MWTDAEGKRAHEHNCKCYIRDTTILLKMLSESEEVKTTSFLSNPKSEEQMELLFDSAQIARFKLLILTKDNVYKILRKAIENGVKNIKFGLLFYGLFFIKELFLHCNDDDDKKMKINALIFATLPLGHKHASSSMEEMFDLMK